VEPEVHGVERFLPEQPIDLIKKGKFHKVPLIAGVTKNEFDGVVACKNLVFVSSCNLQVENDGWKITQINKYSVGF